MYNAGCKGSAGSADQSVFGVGQEMKEKWADSWQVAETTYAGPLTPMT